jgi:hypothetical protein
VLRYLSKGTGLVIVEVGLYMVRSTWFLSSMLLEGIRPYSDLLGHNRRRVVPGVQDPDKRVEELEEKT